jgi:hypothetical protein
LELAPDTLKDLDPADEQSAHVKGGDGSEGYPTPPVGDVPRRLDAGQGDPGDVGGDGQRDMVGGVAGAARLYGAADT